MVVRSNYRTLELAITVAALVTVGCTEDAGDDMLDVRVEVPPEDPDHVVFVGEELVIEPGEDRMYCIYIDAGETMALRDFDMMQGEYGHHAILLASKKPRPSGTVEDCSHEDLADDFKTLVIPIPNVPEGYAAEVPGNTTIVLQSHYVNASDKPLLVRDVIRARRVDPGSVTEWMAPMATNLTKFEIPGDGTPVERTFDCVLDRDVDLLSLGGHMHEAGTSLEVQIGSSSETLERRYLADPWKPEFRDAPPIELLADDPLHLTAGTVIRTTCRWENHTGKVLRFPHEMCSAFGVIAGTKESWECHAKDERDEQHE